MKIDRIISLVQNRLGKGNFHEEVVKEALARAYNTILSGEKNLDPFRRRYTIDVLQNTVGNYYSELPVSIVNIEDSILINQTKNIDVIFVLATTDEIGILNNLDVNKISKTVLFNIKENIIWYEWMDKDIKEVSLECIPDVSEMDIEDEIYVPQNLDEILIETTVNFLVPTPAYTSTNDSSELT